MRFVRFMSILSSALCASAIFAGCNESVDDSNNPSYTDPNIGRPGYGDTNPNPGQTTPGTENQTPGTPETPNPGTPEPPNPGTPATPNPGTPETPNPGTPETPEPSMGADTVTTETCNENTVETCTDNIARFCNEGGTITLRDCSKLSTPDNPLVCKKLAEDNFVDCVAPCNRSTYNAYNACDGNFIEYRDCYEVIGGGTYEFAFTNNPCPKYCNNGTCVDTPEPVAGATCNTSFVPTCYNGNGYDCINNIIVKTSCTGGTTCAMQSGDTHTQCVEKCAGRGDSYACTTINGKPALDNYVCRMGQDASYYLFHETTVCQNSCSNGVCDVTIPTVGSNCDPNTFNDLCAKNALYYCHTEDLKVVSVTCGAGDYMGQPLCRDISDTYSDCVSPCSQGDEGLMQCVKGGNFTYTDNLVCKQALDGAYYYVNEQEKCTGQCKNGVCL